MANEQNLQIIKTKREGSEKGKNGGKKSGEKRRAIKSFKEATRLFCEMTAPEQIAEQVRKHFPDMQDKEINGFTALVFAQKAKALKGDSKAFEIIRDTAGEKPIDRTEHSGDVIVIMGHRKNEC